MSLVRRFRCKLLLTRLAVKSSFAAAAAARCRCTVCHRRLRLRPAVLVLFCFVCIGATIAGLFFRRPPCGEKVHDVLDQALPPDFELFRLLHGGAVGAVAATVISVVVRLLLMVILMWLSPLSLVCFAVLPRLQDRVHARK